MKSDTKKLVAKAIELLGLSETQFAKECGVSQGMVNQMTKGHKKPGWSTCLKIEQVTEGKITRQQLRPDIFGKPDSDKAA